MKKDLHISSMTYDESKVTDSFLGPWCMPIESLDDITTPLFNTNIPPKDLGKYHEVCHTLARTLLPYIAKALNKKHGTTYSLKFWSIMSTTWLTYIIESLHFYYTAVQHLNENGMNFNVKVDETFTFRKLSDPPLVWNSAEYIHSMISFILARVEYNNVTLIKQKMISKHEYFMPKTSFVKRFLQKIVWSLLKSEQSKVLIYGISGINYYHMFKMRLRESNISFAFITHTEGTTDFLDSDIVKMDYNPNNEFEKIVVEFIENNLPISLTNGFSQLLNSAHDYKNKKIVVPSAGFYMDGQLIEIALAKELNDAKLVMFHESGDGMLKVHPDANNYFDNADLYVTWGWKKYADYNNKTIAIDSTIESKFNNCHKEEYPLILYYGKYPDICGYTYIQQVSRDFRKYYNYRTSFINEFEQLNMSELLVLKLHQSKRKCFDEEKLMKSFQLKINNYNEFKYLTMENAAIFVTDYNSASIYSAFVRNVPTIMFFDRKSVPENAELVPFFDDFEKVGILYQNPKDAARKIKDIYHQRDSFWSSDKIQTVREKFLKNYINVSDEWEKNLLSVFKNLL